MTDVAHPGHVDEAGVDLDEVHEIARRLATQRERLAEDVFERARQEIVDYPTPPDPQLLAETLEHLDALIASLLDDDAASSEYLEYVREIAARRAHAGVPLESFLHVARLWAIACWKALPSAVRAGSVPEREAALEIAGRIMDFADRLSSVLTRAYLDEVTDQDLLRNDLLDALLTARGEGSEAVQLARRLHLQLDDSYIAVVVRGDPVHVEDGWDQPSAVADRFERLVEETRGRVPSASGRALTGMRHGNFIILYPAPAAADVDVVRQSCRRLARALDDEVSMGMSRWHEGRGSVGLAYAEAKEAAALAARKGIRQRPVDLEEVLVDNLLSSSPTAQRILGDVIRPLRIADASRRSALVPTLRGYLEAGFNLTQAAESLYVNPNTVVYRLGRVKAITGRDTHNLNDLMVLYLALKLEESQV
jgi:sugar diacid utilization regulator